MRKKFEIPHADPDFNKRLLKLSQVYDPFIFLDSNQQQYAYHRFEWIAAFGCRKMLRDSSSLCFERLQQLYDEEKDWLFGHLSYDLKNVLEELQTSQPDPLAYAPLQFFIPQTVVYARGGRVWVESYEFQSPAELARVMAEEYSAPEADRHLTLESRLSREEYLENAREVMRELQYGNIYEMNLCIELHRNGRIDPLETFLRLNELSKAPFAAFYRDDQRYLLCASPERYLYKSEATLISQPIKGTAARAVDPQDDEKQRQLLRESEKERSENVMIVDLVRNDLSRTAARGSVVVEELFGIYSFPGVHQMISTIRSELRDPQRFCEALKYSFPMGSMTGAPKISAMRIIDRLEGFSRSLYAGSVGYISPQGDFDFNVVIRSLFYEASRHYLSARVGSAITIRSDIEKEYEECLLKAQNLLRVLWE